MNNSLIGEQGPLGQSHPTTSCCGKGIVAYIEKINDEQWKDTTVCAACGKVISIKIW